MIRFLLALITVHASYDVTNAESCHRDRSKETGSVWRANPDADRSEVGFYFPGQLHRTLNSFGIHQCSFYCIRDQKCRSFNYISDTHKCELHLNVRESFIGQQKWVLLNKKWLRQVDGFIPKSWSQYCTRNCFVTERQLNVTTCSPACQDDQVCSPVAGSPLTSVCLQTTFDIESFKLPWTQWSSWGACDLTCGGGSRFRTRSCGPGSQPWKCEGLASERRLCDQLACPQWTHWGPWSDCSTIGSCGKGSKTRERVCQRATSPSDCEGLPTQDTDCYLPSCHATVRLTSGLFGKLLIYDDSELYEPAWRNVCEDMITDDNLISVMKTVCAQLGGYIDNKLFSAQSSGPQENTFLMPLSCDNGQKSLMRCEHNGWREYDNCQNPLQLQCRLDKPIMWTTHSSGIVTYEFAKTHCESLYRRLCYSFEVFPYQNTTGVVPIQSGDEWNPIEDRFNDWIQIGDSLGRTGWIHNDHYNAPTWGTNENSAATLKGHVICCVID